MIKNILLAGIAFFIGSTCWAQNDLTFTLHHLMGEETFALNQPIVNNLEDDFNVTRLEYYISEISIVHDGGNETLVEDVWILVKTTSPTVVNLGSHDITEVEAVHFYIGVDEEHNHGDPASYPQGHALAPKSPSMHWGWTAGYRFVAYEGMGGGQFNQLFQLHGLGDENYFQITLPLETPVIDGTINIEVDADYARGLEDINVAAGVIVHGATGEAKQSLENFRDYVFSPTILSMDTVVNPVDTTDNPIDTTDVTGLNDLLVNQDLLKIYPNPSSNGTTYLTIGEMGLSNAKISVTDIQGREVQFYSTVDSNGQWTIEVKQPGLYFIKLLDEGQTIAVKRFIAN